MQVTEQSTCDIERLLQTVLSAPCPMPTPEQPDCRRDRSELAIADTSDAVCRALTSLDLRVEDFELISIKVFDINFTWLPLMMKFTSLSIQFLLTHRSYCCACIKQTLAADAAQYVLNIIATPGGSSVELVARLNQTSAVPPSSPPSTSSDSISEQRRRDERRLARALKAAALRACVHMGNPSLIVLAPQSQGDQTCADDILTRNAEMTTAFSAASTRTETSADAVVDFGEDCSPLVLIPLLLELNAITGHASVRVSVAAADYVGATYVYVQLAI